MKSWIETLQCARPDFLPMALLLNGWQNQKLPLIMLWESCQECSQKCHQ
jgi:hypothetical protein